MTKQAEQSPPPSGETPADRRGQGPATGPGQTGASTGTEAAPTNGDASPGLGSPELSEAIDRATAAVGQDDGKR